MAKRTLSIASVVAAGVLVIGLLLALSLDASLKPALGQALPLAIVGGAMAALLVASERGEMA